MNKKQSETGREREGRSAVKPGCPWVLALHRFRRAGGFSSWVLGPPDRPRKASSNAPPSSLHRVSPRARLGYYWQWYRTVGFSRAWVVLPAGPSHPLLPRPTKSLSQHLGHWKVQVWSSGWPISALQSPAPSIFDTCLLLKSPIFLFSVS